MEFSGTCAAGTLLLSALGYYSRRKFIESCRVKLITADESLSRVIGTDKNGNSVTLCSFFSKFCPRLTDNRMSYMIPTPYLFSGLLQSVYSVLRVRKRDEESDIIYERELLILKDKGTVSIDWYPPNSDSLDRGRQPIIIIMSGVCGSSEEYSIRCLAKLLADGPLKYSVAVMNHRGSGRTLLTTSRPYDMGWTEDYRDVIKYIRSCWPHSRLMGIGLSLGANVLTKYLGEEGNKCPLSAAVAISCPFDMVRIRKAMQTGGILSSYLLQKVIVRELKKQYIRNKQVILSSDPRLDDDEIMSCSNIEDIENKYLIVAAGYQNREEYYELASSSKYVDDITIPYLAINSLDDTLSTIDGIPVEKFRQNPSIALVLSSHGGHLGFHVGMRPRIWYLDVVEEFLGGIGALSTNIKRQTEK